MTETRRPTALERLEAVAAEVPNAVVAPAKPAAAPLELLDDNEIIQLCIRPSAWSIAFTSSRWVCVLAVLGAALVLASGQFSLAGSIALTAILLALLTCILFSIGQWASQLYVLTNRRVMRFRGLYTVDVAECRLTQVREVRLHVTAAQRWLNIGCLAIQPADQSAPPIPWEHVARPGDVQELLDRAIRKAQSR